MRLLPILSTLVFVAVTPVAATAGTVNFTDGATHSITTPQPSVGVSNATTVNVVSGGSATGDASDADGVSSSGNSAIYLLGGSLTGADASTAPGRGISASTGTVTVSSGTTTGGKDTDGGGGFGGNGIRMISGYVDISGGTVAGGEKSAGSGFGGFALQLNDATFDISGGTLIGGDHNGTSGFPGYSISAFNSSGDISGGTFLTGSGPTAFASKIAISAAGTTLINITGGSFQTASRFQLSGTSTIHVFGTGLSLTGPSFGDLTGTLADGTLIDVAYSLNDSGQIVLHNSPVPEPGSLALFGFGLASLAARRRRHARGPTAA